MTETLSSLGAVLFFVTLVFFLDEWRYRRRRKDLLALLRKDDSK